MEDADSEEVRDLLHCKALATSHVMGCLRPGDEIFLSLTASHVARWWEETISPELEAILHSDTIAYELISDSFGISIDGIELTVEHLQQTLSPVTNEHSITVLLHELAEKHTG